MKSETFLRRYLDHITIQTPSRKDQRELQEHVGLECSMIEHVGAREGDLDETRERGGLGVFVRSLLGLKRDAAKVAFADLLAGRNLRADQIGFDILIIEHLTDRRDVDPQRLYKRPFTDFDQQGVNGVSRQADMRKIVQHINEVARGAAA